MVTCIVDMFGFYIEQQPNEKILVERKQTLKLGGKSLGGEIVVIIAFIFFLVSQNKFDPWFGNAVAVQSRRVCRH